MRKTLVFNEKIDSFIGEHDYFPRIYMPADKLLYSAGIHVYNTSYRIVKHYSNDGVNNTFNDTIVGADNNGLKYWELIFVVNGLKQEESAVLFSKIFKSLTLESSSTAFSSINYATEYQEGDQDPFLATEIWLTPEFLEHKWRVPIAVQTTPSTEFPGSGIDGTTFFADADIRGTWMKVTLRYYGTDDIFIKNAITKFLISNS